MSFRHHVFRLLKPKKKSVVRVPERQSKTYFIMMKKFHFSLFIVLLLSAVSAHSQSLKDGWVGTVDFGPVINLHKGGTTSLGVNVAATRQVHEYLHLGAGTGFIETFKFDAGPAIPLFVRAHAEKPDTEMSPFFTFDMGYCLNTENTRNGGFMFNPTLGVRFGDILFGLGYYGVVHNGVSSNLNIRLGYAFGAHRSNTPLDKALRKFKFSVDFGISFTGNIYSETYEFEGNNYNVVYGYYPSPSVNLALLYPITDNFDAGLMIGFHCFIHKFKADGLPKSEVDDEFINRKNVLSVPLALRLKYKFRELLISNRYYPFAQLDLGFATYTNSKIKGEEVFASNTQFHFAPCVGLSYDVADGKHSVDLGFSYYSKKLKLVDGESKHNINRGVFRVAIGYTF